ncbi:MULTISPECIES: hypothetical protein [Halobacillus]|nr:MULTISPECIES: hypothetical protein [Halobacillus]
MASGNKKLAETGKKKQAERKRGRGKDQGETAVNHVVNVYDPI